eukprot:gene12362-14502_t
MNTILSLFVLLCLAHATLAVSSTCSYTVGETTRTLASIAHFSFDVSGTDVNSLATNYRFQVCAGQSPCQATDGSNSVSCQDVDGTTHRSLGDITTQTISGGGASDYEVDITYTGGSSAGCVSPATRQTVVQLKCGKDVKLVSATEPTLCSHVFVVETPDACAPANTTECTFNDVDLSGLALESLHIATEDFYDPLIRGYHLSLCKNNVDCFNAVNSNVPACQTNPDHGQVAVVLGTIATQSFISDFEGNFIKYSGGQSDWCEDESTRSVKVKLQCGAKHGIVPYTVFYFASAPCQYRITVSSPSACPLTPDTIIVVKNDL